MTNRRYYCFFDDITTTCQLFYTKQWHFKKKLIPLKNIKLDLQGQKIDIWLKNEMANEVNKFEKLKLSQQFWQLANPELKTALLISIYLRQNHHRGVFNVFTINWLENSEFKNIHQLQTQWFKTLNLRQIYERIARSLGVHEHSLRFDQIHLAQDKIDGQTKFSIHYDLYNNNHLKNLGLIKHVLLEDIKKNKKLT